MLSLIGQRRGIAIHGFSYKSEEGSVLRAKRVLRPLTSIRLQ
jgi:hypothetical protein